jgi:dTDP-glucose 4,6-dehydratase
LEQGRSGEVYNFGGNSERTNLHVVRSILRALDRSEDLITFVRDRPGHDRRYAMDPAKAREELGWEPRADFEAELARTVEWYRERFHARASS